MPLVRDKPFHANWRRVQDFDNAMDQIALFLIAAIVLGLIAVPMAYHIGMRLGAVASANF